MTTKVDRVYLREWRLAKGLTQPELAKRVGTVKSEISRLEKGSRRMTLDWMSSISKALGISVEDLMSVPPIGFGAVSAPPPSRTEPRREGVGGYEMKNAVTINGDDWAGTYSPGDVLLYDTTKKSTAAPGLFAVEIEGEPLVRRVTPSPEGTLLTCGNPAYPPVPLSDDYSVLGRIVARLHRI
jgi:transcriptional regulator with XRE-family HTH domain